MPNGSENGSGTQGGALRRIARVVWAMLAIVLLNTGCGGGGGTGGGSGGGGGGGGSTCTVSSVMVTTSAASIAPGGTATLTATVNATSACANTVTWSVFPGGGTLTANGNTATFTTNTGGSFSIVATSTADATKQGSALIGVIVSVGCAAPNGTVVTHSSNISSSETWSGNGTTHLVPNDIQVTGSAVLTIQSCVIVALGSGASIGVTDSAKLVAAGGADTARVFFRPNDPSQPWGRLRGLSATSMIELHWTNLEKAGAGGTLALENSAIAAIGPGYAALPAAVLKVDNVLIDHPQGVGVYLDANAAFTADSQNLNITGAGSYPVHSQTTMAIGSVPSGNYTGNVNDEFLVSSANFAVFADLTINDRGVPLRFPTDRLNVAPPLGAPGTVTLTIGPGVVMKFPKLSANTPGARVAFGGNGNAPNNPVGVLNALGTPQAPIVFTSGEANPSPGDWVGIWLNTANGSRLDNVQISYAGAPSSLSFSNCKPQNTADNAALIVGDSDTQYIPPSNLITNSVISGSAGFGIDANWKDPGTVFDSPDLTATNTFTGYMACAQTFNAVSGSCPRGCTAN